jgi:hypothetical protein
MRKPDGSPWDLKRAAADPFHKAVVPPGTEKRGAAAARRLMGYTPTHPDVTGADPGAFYDSGEAS